MYTHILQHILAQASQSQPTEDSPPSGREMFAAGEIKITGSRITFYDSWGWPDDGVSVEVPSSTYQLSVEVQTYGNDCRIARVLAALPNATPQRGDCKGTFFVDVASAGICDGDALCHFANQDSDAWDTWSQSFTDRPYEEEDVIGKFTCEPAATEIFYCSTGFGDGSYPVYELVDAGKVVGAEVLFLLPEQTFFGPGPDEDGDDEE